jgi:alpha,alpha-trehalose phosphorylase
MAARNLRVAADVAERRRARSADFDVNDGEIAAWRAAAAAVAVPYDAELGVTAQADGFTRYRRWDVDLTRPEQRPLLLHAPYYLLYSSQIVKQADLVLALYLCGDCFDDEQKRRDFDYYEPITIGDSSLSAPIQAIVAAEVGRLELAYDYFRETALVDLHDTDGNTADGLHLASLAGAWLVAVAGFGGLRDHGETLAFAPRLPPTLSRLRFRIAYRGRCLRIDVRPDTAVYELLAGDPLDVRHYGAPLRVERDLPQTRDCRREGQAKFD